jgi:hypothetical protein
VKKFTILFSIILITKFMKYNLQVPKELDELSDNFTSIQFKVLKYTEENFNIGDALINFPIKIPNGASVIPINSFGGKSWRMGIYKHNIELSVWLDIVSCEAIYIGAHFAVLNITTNERQRFEINEVNEFNKYIAKQLTYTNTCKVKIKQAITKIIDKISN